MKLSFRILVIIVFVTLLVMLVPRMVLSSGDLDFGDAPDPTYPTLLASNGARHHFNPMNPMLGSKLDIDLDGKPDPHALGDDNDGFDDEDGVAFTTLLAPGQQADITVAVSGSAGKLNAWVDFNGDGD